MDLVETHSWTFGGIVGSFIDLVVAYFLLCGSALAFFGSKVCNIFGLYLPCPCSGIFGYQNKDLCLHMLFVEWPLRIICHVQMLSKSRLPFNYVLSKDQARNLNIKLNRDGKFGKRVLEAEGEGETSCGSFSCMASRNLGNRESGYDTKGKRSVNQKQRSGNRRRRRVSLAYGKFYSAQSSRSVGSGVPVFPSTESDMKTENNQRSGLVDGDEDSLQGDGISPTSIDMSERSWYRFQRSLSFEENKVMDTISVGKIKTKTEDKLEIFGNEEKTILMLERALEEERAASAALLLDLEKERAAAASATDEAMAMILRLQKEKASLEMEAMQYQRLIEEKFAHDEDEMNVLKEILVRRERENHFLEKELEVYRQMSSSQDNHLADDLENDTLAPQTGIITEKTFSRDEEKLKKEVDPTVHDVHVIDVKMELQEQNHYAAPSFGVLDVHSSEALSDNSNSSTTKAKSCIYGSELNNSSDKALFCGFRRKSSSAFDTERVKINSEVERLREMLRIVQDGKERLTASDEKSEMEDTQLELLEDMVHEHQAFQHLQEPS